MPFILKVLILIRWLIAKTLGLIRRFPRFSEWLLVGFIAGSILSLIPVLGHFLAAVAVALAFFSGVVSEVRDVAVLRRRG